MLGAILFARAATSRITRRAGLFGILWGLVGAFVVGAQRVGPGRRPSAPVISPHASLVCAQRLASVLPLCFRSKEEAASESQGPGNAWIAAVYSHEGFWLDQKPLRCPSAHQAASPLPPTARCVRGRRRLLSAGDGFYKHRTKGCCRDENRCGAEILGQSNRLTFKNLAEGKRRSPCSESAETRKCLHARCSRQAA